MKKNLSVSLVLKSVVLLIVFFSISINAQDANQGEQLYKVCAGCHGFKAEGSQSANSPKLSGQESWYLERQIKNFRDGLRGRVANDPHGLRMAQMAQVVQSDQDINNLIAYIQTLPNKSTTSSVKGDIEKGKGLYATCMACHGNKAEGKQALNAPGLLALDDWYQLDQLVKFKDGRRGAHPNDAYGQQMAPMAKLLADEQAMRDVVSYIHSLQ